MTFTVTLILRYFERKLDGPENYSMIGQPAPQIMLPKNN